MARPLVAEATLPKIKAPVGPVCAIAAATTMGAGFGIVTDSFGLAVAASSAGAAAIAGTITRHVVRRRRQELVDLFLLRMGGMLGWQAPERQHVLAKRWRGGFGAMIVRGVDKLAGDRSPRPVRVVAERWQGGVIGYPQRLVLHYNPVGDESVPEIIAEARRLSERAFGAPYRLSTHKQKGRQGRIVLARAESDSDRSREAQIERVNTVVAKTFGGDAKAAVKLNDADQVVEITVRYEVTPRLSSSALRARIESSLSSVLDGRWRAFWDLQNDVVRFEVRPSLADVIPNPNIAPPAEDVDPLKTYDKLRVPFAMDEDGNVITWKPKDDPHGLVTGKTGKGKTVCLLGIVQFLAAHGWEIWGIDGKRIELLGLREWPNVKLIAGRIDHQARVAHEIYTLMQKRFEDYEAGKVRLEDFTPVLFVVDEFKTFKNAVNRWYRSVKPKGPGSQAPVLEEISDFVSLARKVRMHLIIGLQRPDAEFLTGDMRDNFNFRVSFGRLSPDGAKMMWDSFSTGVAIPVNAKGRGIAYNQHGVPVEIQSFWTPDPYQTQPDRPETWVFPGDDELVDNIRPNVRLHELMAIVDPEDLADIDETGDALNYNDYMASRIVPAGRAPELIRKAAGIFVEGPASAENTQPSTSRVAVLERIQLEEEEPEISDEEEMFAGYSPARDAVIEELLDDNGDLAHEGALLLVDADNDTWGLVDFAELDLADEGYISISYRDYETGEPGSLDVPADDTISIRLPEGTS